MLLFPTNNILDIPALLPWHGAVEVPGPVLPWGNHRPTPSLSVGTWHFYVADAKFNALWRHPHRPLETQALALVEPNFSLLETTPTWEAAYWTGKKRTLARYWQSHGRRVFVDLNVPTRHAELNMAGVPSGYPAFATRGFARSLDLLEGALALARAHADPHTPTLLVYSGGETVRAWCHAHPETIYLPHIRQASGLVAPQPHP